MFDFTDFSQKLTKSLDFIKKELATLRTGKATPQLLDGVVVDAYGAKMKVNEVANVSAPDPNMLVIAPWDKSLLESVEKAIAVAGLNLNPVVDGAIIRIVVPPLTQERREEMVKSLHQKIESGRVMLRGIRTDTKREIEDQAGETGVSEDDIKANIEKLDRMLHEAMDQLDALAKQKETDLMTI